MKSYSSPIAKTFGWVWIAFALLNLADLVWRGSSVFALLAAAVLVFTVALVAVFVLRPKVVAAEEGIRVVNPLRQTLVPWGAVSDTDVTDILRIHADDQVVRAWAMREHKRARVRANLRRGRIGTGELPEDPTPVDHAAQELRDEAQRRTRSGDAQPGGTPVTRWSPMALATLAVPATALVIAAIAV